jgi:hypothetical protein
LDLLFAASQLTSSSSSDFTHDSPSMPVNHGESPCIHLAGRAYGDVVSPSSDGELSYYSPRAAEPNSGSFVQILMDILNITDPAHTSIICWVPDGKSFLIADQNRFEKEILPTYFRGSLFNSFVRKLNRWGFRRLKRTGHASSFAHDLFLRDKPWLCSRMKCQSKPNFKKLNAKVKDDVRQYACGNVATYFSISPREDVHAPSPSGGRLVSNNYVMQSLSTPPSNVTNIPSPPTLPSNMSMDELQQRQLLIASISKTSEMERQLLVAQMHQRRQLQILEMQHLKDKSALTDESLAQRHLQPRP